MTPFYVMMGILLIFMILAFAITVIDARRSRKSHRQLKKEKQQSDYDKLLISARLQLSERMINFVRKEIHRNISVDLSAAKIKLQYELKKLGLNNSSDFIDIVDLLTKSIEGLRNIEKDFDTDLIREEGLLQIIDQEKERIEKFYDATIEFNTAGEPIYMEVEKELVIFSVIHDAFRYALHKGDGAMIGLKLNYIKDAIVVEITNFFRGFEPSWFLSNGTGNGTPDIRQRAELLNGWCFFDESRSNTIVMKIPY
jgi:signal transduction histidine kinase